MSSYAVEDLLYRIQVDPTFAGRFRADPGEAMAGYTLTETERAQLAGWEVDRMVAAGVSGLLALSAFLAVNGPEAMPDYVARINRTAASA